RDRTQGSAFFHRVLARVLLDAGQPEASVASCDRALEKGLNEPDLWFTRGRARFAVAQGLAASPAAFADAEEDMARGLLGGDDEAFDRLGDREHVMSVFGRGRLFGRSGVLVSGVREGGCAFPVPRWRAQAPAAIARRPAALDWSQARSVRLWVAARGETRLA